MYGRVFEQMYEGSMMGAGMNVFSLWNYMLIKARRGVVEVNPELVAYKLAGADRISDTVKEVEAALEYLMQPDPKSRSSAEDGRRIIKEGQFQYRIVNWEHYENIRNEAEKRAYNRQAQADHRLKIKDQPETPKELPSPRFQKPTIAELITEGLSQDQAEAFFHHFESNGWKVGGKAPMKSWKSAVVTWKKRSGDFQVVGSSKSGNATSSDEMPFTNIPYSERTKEQRKAQAAWLTLNG